LPARYHIADEPRPGRLQTMAVNPFWPLLGLMLGGPWLAWPWFALNGFAVGSPTRRRELAIVALAVLGSAALVGGLIAASAGLALTGVWVKFGLLALTIFKLGMGYVLFTTQSRSFGLYAYYGGPVQNGVAGILLGIFLDDFVTKALGRGFLALVLG
jgi:hypothetical protein